jgi:hypothetical protein
MQGNGEQGKGAAAANAAQRRLTEEEVEWGFRLLAGRPPVSEQEFAQFLATNDFDAMRRAFTNLGSYHAFFDAVLTSYPAYAVPLFLMRPPAKPVPEWRFQPPDLDQPTSQLCTASQYTEATFLEIAQAMGVRPGVKRSLWEQVWIISVLATAGVIAPGHRGLAIEAGRERIAAVAAARGVAIQATGIEPDGPPGIELRRSQLFYPDLVHIEDFDRLVSFESIGPAGIASMAGADLDFCFSIGMPNRLGSIAAALDFFEASLAPLKPGGIAAHSFAFNLTSDQVTWELPDLVILRRRDIEALAERLAAAGHALLPLNTHPGHALEDERVTSEPGAMLEHRQRHGVVVSTSFGLAIRKAG